jgi:hydrogenase maturation protease
MSRYAVIGIGNLLKRDDGVGVHAIRYLRGKLPPDVDLVEGGTYSLNLLPFLEKREKVIFIDGIDAQAEPGAVFRFSPDQLPQRILAVPISVHDIGLYDLVAAARLLDQCPGEIAIIAVQVKDMETGVELSEEVRKALPLVLGLVRKEIGIE